MSQFNTSMYWDIPWVVLRIYAVTGNNNIMNFFYERAETETEVTITFKSHWVYFFYATLILCVARAVYPEIQPLSEFTSVATYSVLALVGIRIFKTKGVNKEVQEAVKAKKAKLTGATLSPINPLVVVISKDEVKEG